MAISFSERPISSLTMISVAFNVFWLVYSIVWLHPAGETMHDNVVLPPSDTLKEPAFQPLHNDNGATRTKLELTLVDNQHQTHYSQGHCLGDNYNMETSWMYTSCHVKWLCLDVQKGDYVVLRNPYETQLVKTMYNNTQHNMEFHTYASSLRNAFSIGAINPQWPPEDWIRLKRTFRSIQPPLQFYALPDNVVMVPFHSMAGFNPGHLVWDDFMPLWLLLDMFGLWTNNNKEGPRKEMLFMRESMKQNPLWASCEDKLDLCRTMMHKLFPVMTTTTTSSDSNTTTTGRTNRGVGSSRTSSTLLFDPMETLSQLLKTSIRKTDKKVDNHLVCAKEGAVGLGTLSDHGMKQHGWWSIDYKWNHNVGRSPQFYKFRNFIMDNLGVDSSKQVSSILNANQGRHFVLFSQASSQRAFDMEPFFQFIKNKFSQTVDCQYVMWKDYSIKEQVELASRATMIFSVSGGGSVPAMFLPKGASLVLWYARDVADYDQQGMIENPRLNPARLDYDVWNNLGYLRTHWIPMKDYKPELPTDSGVFEQLVRHELDIMSKL